MKKMLFILIITLSLSTLSIANGSISGTVKDNETGELLEYANVTLKQNGNIIIGGQTDFYGYFMIKPIPPGEYDIEASMIGYEYENKKIIIEKDHEYKIDFLLISQEVMMDEMVVTKYKMALISVNDYHDFPEYNYNTESYDYITENNFKNVIDNPLSTFSIDVDRASYSNVRRFLNNSSMPNKDAVRIEEMINYFNYDYERPKNGQAFNTHLELGDCPWNPQNKLLLIGIQGEETAEENIPPCNLVFLIDVSGSMNAYNKLPLLKSSFRILVDKLRPQDRVAIVVYAGSAGCVLPSVSGEEKQTILNALDRLEAGGSTAGGAGINLAYKIASENFIEGGNNRVILATDGDFNVGASSNSEMERLIESKRDMGIYLTALGFGMGNYKDSKMKKLSIKGNGNYAYIDNITEADKIFGQELWGTLYTIAKDVKIQIEFNPSKVKEYRLIGYENRLMNNEDFNNDKKDAGDIGSGHSVTAIYELIPADKNPEEKGNNNLNYQTIKIIDSNDLMTIKIRYKAPDSDTSCLITNSISDNDISAKRNSEIFLFAAAVAEFGMLLRDSEFKGNSNYDQVLELAEKAKGEDKYGYKSEFIGLVKKAKLLSKH